LPTVETIATVAAIATNREIFSSPRKTCVWIDEESSGWTWTSYQRRISADGRTQAES
jgi:hypothetical protein